MKQKVAVVIQPGKLGDIIITAPIAEYYKKRGYQICWPVFSNFFETTKRLNKEFNVIDSGIRLPDEAYFGDKRLGFSLSFDQDGKLAYNSLPPQTKASISVFRELYTNYIPGLRSEHEEVLVLDCCTTLGQQLEVATGWPGHDYEHHREFVDKFVSGADNRNWIDLRYYLSDVPLKERWNFKFTRDAKKEEELLKFIKEYSREKYGSEDYTIVHNYQGKELNFPIENQINFAYIEGYEIFDWLQVLQNAKKIVCVDSSLCNFVEVVPEFKDVDKVYLGSEEPYYHSYMRNIMLNNWTNMSQEESLSYDGLQDE